MEGNPGNNRQILALSFGLPLMTSAIVMASMYFGHMITTRSERPTQVLVEAAPPKIDVNVPQSAPPNIQVSTTPAQVDVHVPTQPPATVTVNTPQAAPPNITISPATPTVTVIDKREFPAPVLPPAPAKEIKEAEKEPAKPAINESAKPALAPVVTPTPAPSKPQSNLDLPKKDESHPTPTATVLANLDAASAKLGAPTPKNFEIEPNIDTLYDSAARYIQAYCKKNRLDPAAEERKWTKNWRTGLEQALTDNTDSNEQSYINRVVILKRDSFEMATASPEKIVEACRIILRYRDGNLVWLKAMRDSLTKDNLKKTVTFLAAGP